MSNIFLYEEKAINLHMKLITTTNYHNKMKYTTSQINREWKIKVYGLVNGVKVNKLVGVSGLIKLIGIELANKFICRAFDALACKVVCKLRRGLQITFYAY